MKQVNIGLVLFSIAIVSAAQTTYVQVDPVPDPDRVLAVITAPGFDPTGIPNLQVDPTITAAAQALIDAGTLRYVKWTGALVDEMTAGEKIAVDDAEEAACDAAVSGVGDQCCVSGQGDDVNAGAANNVVTWDQKGADFDDRTCSWDIGTPEEIKVKKAGLYVNAGAIEVDAQAGYRGHVRVVKNNGAADQLVGGGAAVLIVGALAVRATADDVFELQVDRIANAGAATVQAGSRWCLRLVRDREPCQ